MITLRQSKERGHFRSDWLDSRHTFSFDTYHDPRHMGFRALRVINEDRVQPGHGFPLHPHRDMEILSFVFSGALRHEDDLGNAEIIEAGELQRISAGRGIRHSESNPSQDLPVHFLQIWIIPEATGLDPGYQKKRFAGGEKNSLRLIASGDGRDGSATLRRDVGIYAVTLEGKRSLEVPLRMGRHGWLQMVEGELALNGLNLLAGDGASASEEKGLVLTAGKEATFLFFDLN